MKRRSIFLSFWFVFLLPAGAATTAISDATFDLADWSVQELVGGYGTTMSTYYQSAGGNPGTYLRVRCDLVATARVHVASFYSAQLFSPSAQGSIVSIEYGYDRINFPEAAFRDVNDHFALLQGGTVYAHSMGNIATATTSWESMSATLTASDFDVWGTETGSPDFSSAGDPITFGFIRGSSTNNSSGTRHTESGTDNWSVTIQYDPVPEPHGLLPIGLIGVGLLLRNRRARA